ncbi:MAG: Uncharacterized protein XD58_0139 [Thermotoga sp. 50_1627]|uniref:hypothetical protein n=1 Tax=Pseudothermotoga sp. TaxID=2033661 RepID=UPI00076C7883|nr:MAG: Uncharacterized protein XD45_0128 [Thermotoga sp. 50_64]KUK25978.1 MAG: Uncharacterized protein XD58_0139 [Thermotoga sp. 50_1627]MBC7116039.1 hypothetical protein [Pseudothermotoga sp.]MDK2922667.1 hypothetical protein [Pseudothermotoga sp.]HBT38641.1 hypothetical protein [Pseudothermotoga sp.]
MRFFFILPLLFTFIGVAATVNFDYALGSDAYFGIRVVPRIEFWRVEALLDFPFGFKLVGGWLTPIASSLESLKYLNVDLDPGGVRFNVPYLVQTAFANIDFHESSLVGWAFNGSLGGVIGPENAMFFKTVFFNASIDSAGQYHVGLSFPVGSIELGGFTSSRGYGFGVLMDPFMFFYIPKNGFRFAVERKNVYLIGQYLDGTLSLSMGWFGKEEWFLVGTNGVEARLKFGELALVMKLQKERWYAGFSFPIVW